MDIDNTSPQAHRMQPVSELRVVLQQVVLQAKHSNKINCYHNYRSPQSTNEQRHLNALQLCVGSFDMPLVK
jgi:hypothetical protein